MLPAAFEPHYVELFKDLKARGDQGGPMWFGHMLSPSAAPPAFMEQAVGGLPPYGVAAIIRQIAEQSDGTVKVLWHAA